MFKNKLFPNPFEYWALFEINSAFKRTIWNADIQYKYQFPELQMSQIVNVFGNYKRIKNWGGGRSQMVQQLSSLAVLAEDMGSVSSTYMTANNNLKLQEDQKTSSSFWAYFMHMGHRQICSQVLIYVS